MADEQQKMDAELLECQPRVGASTFAKALSNRIAQDFGKYVHISLTSINYNKYK